MKLALTTLFLAALALEANAEETQVLLQKQRPVRRNHNYVGGSKGTTSGGTVGTHSTGGQSKGSDSTGSKSGGTNTGVGTSGATSTGSKGSTTTGSKGSTGSSSKGSSGGGGPVPIDPVKATPVPVRAPGAPNLSNDPYKNPGQRERKNRK